MAETATVQIAMPEMGESVTEGIVLEWHVAEGDFVNEGDTVVEVSTDKVDAEVPAPTSGVITKLLVAVDDEVPVGAPLAEMEAGRGLRGSQAAAGPAAGETPAGEDVASFSEPPPADPQRRRKRRRDPAAGNGADVRATPVARRVAEATGVDLGFGQRDGPGGEGHQGGRACGRRRRRQRRRCRRLPARRSSCGGRRRCWPRRWTRAATVPTATSFRTIAVDTLDAKRKAINAVLKERGMKVSFTHLVAWAIVAGDQGLPGDGPDLREARRQAVRDRGRPGQPRDRRRRREARTARTA